MCPGPCPLGRWCTWLRSGSVAALLPFHPCLHLRIFIFIISSFPPVEVMTSLEGCSPLLWLQESVWIKVGDCVAKATRSSPGGWQSELCSSFPGALTSAAWRNGPDDPGSITYTEPALDLASGPLPCILCVSGPCSDPYPDEWRSTGPTHHTCFPSATSPGPWNSFQTTQGPFSGPA